MASQKFQGLFSPLEVVSTNNLLKIEQDRCRTTMTRVYYSDIFKIFYIFMIFLSITCLISTILGVFFKSLFMVGLELIVTVLLAFDTIYRLIMQGHQIYFKHRWNLIDVFVIVTSVIMLWVGANIGGRIGETETISGATFIGIRSFIQFLRLILNIKKKKAQDIQIIDLNDMSEADDYSHAQGNKKKNEIFDEEHKNEYQESQPEALFINNKN